jgi:hypothetical protein
MTIWRQFRTPRACLFAVLLAVLAGCDGGDNAAPTSTSAAASTSAPDTASTSTFDTTQLPNVADDAQIPNEPAVGTVTIVPGKDTSPPVTEGGLPLPTIPIATNNVPSVALQVRAPRFSEVAPDTIGGATYQSSETLSYDLGDLVASTGESISTFTDDKVIITPVQRWLRYPQTVLDPLAKPARYSIIVFLHGQHNYTDPSYQGYDYMARDLASHGYVVLSINANAINGPAGGGDESSQSRAELVLGTLDRLRQIDKQGQVEKDGKPGLLDPLKGKLDFKRVGIMGHSRGGQGIANTVKLNETRRNLSMVDLFNAVKQAPESFADAYPDLVAVVVPKPITTFDALLTRSALSGFTPEDLVNYFDVDATSSAAAIAQAALYFAPKYFDPEFEAAVATYNIFLAAGAETAPPYNFKGAFMLAPTDVYGNLAINNVPLAMLLPSCDGDVGNLEGARTYDHNRFGPDTDGAPRYQILVKGANHNFYNTVWTADDYANNGKEADYCGYSRAGSIRLSTEDQRHSGNFIISSFMRYHVGGEQKFAAYWNSAAQLPAVACPAGAKTCDDRVLLTVQKGDTQRKLIHRFDADDSLSISQLGGAFVLKDFDASARCDMPYGDRYSLGDCSPYQLPDFEYPRYMVKKGLVSIADHAELVWTKPNASVTADLSGTSATGYDSLTFRIAVTLIDSAGHEAKLLASDYSDALYNAPRAKANGMPMVDNPADTPFNDGQVRVLLNMVAIPLKAFQGIDMG